MGQGIAKEGGVFPIFPILGWIVCLCRFSKQQLIICTNPSFLAQQIGTSAPLLVAANTVGGVAAKLISPQSAVRNSSCKTSG